MNPQITLIVPVYNGSRFLAELLDTVCAQTYPEWICLCINDGSTDSSEAIIRSYLSRDPRIQLISKENGGTGSARNVGLSNVKTPYIMFADQDDWLHPQSFEVAHTLITAAQADVLTFERTRIYEGSFRPAPIDLKSLIVKPLDIAPQEQFLVGGNQYTCFVWQRIFRAASIQGIRFPETSGGEDIVYMYDVSCQAQRWVFCDAILYGIRENRQSTSRAVSPRYIQNYLLAMSAMSQSLERNGIPSLRRKAFLTESLFGFSIVCVMFNGRKTIARETFEALNNFLSKADTEGLLASSLTPKQSVMNLLIRKRLYFFLRCFSWVFLPYFERHLIKASIRQFLR